MFNWLAALSLVLCVLTVVLLPRSRRGFDAWLWVGPHSHFALTTVRGMLDIQIGREFNLQSAGITTGFRSGQLPRFVGGLSDDEKQWPVWLLIASFNDKAPKWLAWTGISFGDGPHTPDYPPNFWQGVGDVPLWYFTAIFALFPLAMWWRPFRYFQRRRRGVCPSCGYNLTGNVSGVCPECGKPISSPA